MADDLLTQMYYSTKKPDAALRNSEPANRGQESSAVPS
jgi:hypothetical protein